MLSSNVQADAKQAAAQYFALVAGGATEQAAADQTAAAVIEGGLQRIDAIEERDRLRSVLTGLVLLTALNGRDGQQLVHGHVENARNAHEQVKIGAGSRI